jgi:GT2 family glycosyltransferase
MNDSPPKVSIVILNWNQKEMTLTCLSSLRKISYPHYEVILVDNASEDDSVSAIREEFPRVTVIENEKNLGVAGGRNVGLEVVQKKGTDYMLFLDNDTIVDPEFITEMIKEGERDKDIGILTAKIYFYDRPNTIWSAGGKLSLYRCHFSVIGYEEEDTGQYDETREVDHVPGCCLMINKEVVDKIGLFDEDFVQYFGEDTDWCLKARREGYTIVYVPASRLWHHIIKKTAVSDRYMYLKGRNLMLFMRKHAKVRHWIVFVFYFIFASFKVLFQEARRGNLKQFLAMARGTWDAFKTKKNR